MAVLGTRTAYTATEEARRAGELEAQKRLARQLADEDFVHVMGTTIGRRVMWRLYTRTEGVAFSTNATQMASNAALRDFAKREIRDRAMALCPDSFQAMHDENKNTKHTDE